MIKQLPRELWVYIIQSIDSVSQLAECRLVCKDLNAICEPTIFTKEIVIKSEEAAVKFYGYLSKNPKNGACIKRLKFDHQIESMALMKELLRIVFNPAMESLDGVIDADEFYLCINSISDKSPVPFTSLKRVPHPSIISIPFVNTLLKLQSSLEVMHLNVDEVKVYPILRCLSEFPCLTDITFEGMFDSISELEAHLVKCPQLQQLTLNGCWQIEAVVNSNLDVMWRAEDVVKANALKKLTITDFCAIEMLEYLLFKYTNVETVELFLDIPSESGLYDDDVERAINALKQASLQQIRLKLRIEGSEFHDVLQYLVTNRVSYTITDLIDGLVDIRINQL